MNILFFKIPLRRSPLQSVVFTNTGEGMSEEKDILRNIHWLKYENGMNKLINLKEIFKAILNYRKQD